MPMASSRVPNLPAGFRFHPTDEELIVHYLMNQASSLPCPVPIVAEVNIYHCNPWDLPAKALFGENKEWYFFSPRDRKYPNGGRPNRAAGSGYWKATGTDKAILSAPTNEAIGVKKALVFYGGKPPKGTKTDWIMHEYRLTGSANNNNTSKQRRGSSMRLDDWVLCRIYKKSNDFQPSDPDQEGSTVEEESLNNNTNSASAASPKSDAHDDHFQFQPATTMSKSYSITDLLNTIDDYSALSQILDAPAAELAEPPLTIYPRTQTHESLNNNNVMMNSSHLNLPQAAAGACPDHVAPNSCNGLMKRKRVMTMDDDGAESSSFDGGSSRKLKLLPASDSRSSGHYSHFVGSYCNQQLADTNGGGFQYGSLLSYPFIEMQ